MSQTHGGNVRDYKVIRWQNDIELMASGINQRMENKRDLDARVKLFNFHKEMRNLQTRPRNKIVGLLKRFTAWVR